MTLPPVAVTATTSKRGLPKARHIAIVSAMPRSASKITFLAIGLLADLELRGDQSYPRKLGESEQENSAGKAWPVYFVRSSQGSRRIYIQLAYPSHAPASAGNS
ncbi:MAG: hypothetical protein MKZ95_02000 [Pirellulales bacterium]|nr:hypothetical protein [Pirellulales bacterium]